MSKICQVSDKKRNKSNKVSFSNKHHRYFQEPNLQTKRFWDEEQKRFVRIRASVKALKTITKYGLRAALKRYNTSEEILYK